MTSISLPLPLQGFSITSISKKRSILIGGLSFNSNNEPSSFPFILDYYQDNQIMKLLTPLSFDGDGSNPGDRYHHATALIDNTIYVFGGYGSDHQFLPPKLYGLNLDENVWNEVELIRDDIEEEIEDEEYASDATMTESEIALASNDTTTQSNLSIPPLESRMGHTMHPHPTLQNTIILFGGYTSKSVYINTIHLIHLLTNKVIELNIYTRIPRPRSMHTSIIYENSLLLFGGFDGKRAISDGWILDFNKGGWYRMLDGPEPRFGHCSFVDEDWFYVLGGKTNSSNLNDLWGYNLKGSNDPKWERITNQALCTASGVFGSKVEVMSNGVAIVFGATTLSFDVKPQFKISYLETDSSSEISPISDPLSLDSDDELFNTIQPLKQDQDDKVKLDGSIALKNGKTSYIFTDHKRFSPIDGVHSNQTSQNQISNLKEEHLTNGLNSFRFKNITDSEILDSRSFYPDSFDKTRPITNRTIKKSEEITGLDGVVRSIHLLPNMIMEDLTEAYTGYEHALSDVAYLRSRLIALTQNSTNEINHVMEDRIDQMESKIIQSRAEVWKLRTDRTIYQHLLDQSNQALEHVVGQVDELGKLKYDVTGLKEVIDAKRSKALAEIEKDRLEQENRELRSRLQLKDLEVLTLRDEVKVGKSRIDTLELALKKASKTIHQLSNQLSKQDDEDMEGVGKKGRVPLGKIMNPMALVGDKVLVELNTTHIALHRANSIIEQLREKINHPQPCIASPSPLIKDKIANLTALHNRIEQTDHDISSLYEMISTTTSKLNQDHMIAVNENRARQVMKINREVTRRNKAVLNAISNLTNGQFTTSGLDHSTIQGMKDLSNDKLLTEIMTKLPSKSYLELDHKLVGNVKTKIKMLSEVTGIKGHSTNKSLNVINNPNLNHINHHKNKLSRQDSTTSNYTNLTLVNHSQHQVKPSTSTLDSILDNNDKAKDDGLDIQFSSIALARNIIDDIYKT